MIRFVCMLKHSLFLFLITLFVSSAQGQGRSFYHNFNAKEYDASPQNWCIHQDKNGLMYVGNTNALLTYDGENWRKTVINYSIVRSIAEDKNGKIYIGAQGDFGFLEANVKGEMVYKSLLNLLPDSLQLFSDVWKTYAIDNKVIFQTFDYIFVYENNKITTVLPENSFHFGYQANNQFIVVDRQIGLKYLKNNTLVLFKGGSFFADKRIYGCFKMDSDIVAVTRENGLVKFKIQADSIYDINSFKTEIDEQLIQDEVYCASLIANNQIALGTLNNGCYIISANGVLAKQYNKASGLKSNIVNYIYTDHQNALWLALDEGLIRIEHNGPLSYIDENMGVEGGLNSFIVYKNKLLFGTTKGLYIIDKQITRATQYDGIKAGVLNFCIVKNGSQEVVLLSTETGTYTYDGNSFKKLNDDYGFYAVQSRMNPTIIYQGTKDGLNILQLKNGEILTKPIKQTIIPEVRRIVETQSGSLWLGTAYDGLYQVNNPTKANVEFIAYDVSNGLPDNSYNNPFLVNNEVLFGTINGIKVFNEKSKMFEIYKGFGSEIFKTSDQIYQIVEGFNNTTWLFKTNDLIHEFILVNNSTKETSYPLRRMTEFDAYQCIVPQNENVTWFGGPDGLFRYDASIKSNSDKNFKTLIRSIYSNNDTLFGGYYGFDNNGKAVYTQPESFIPKITYKNNNISFEYAALSFDNEKENVYSFYLEGFDAVWSSWSIESKKSYTNLYEGTYTFHIKSKNIYGTEGIEDTFSFTVLPPWYRTFWAYLGYAILGIALIYLITQLSVRRLKIAKIKLEAIVVNRTAEVVAEKEEVEKQKKIVETKNKDITDSINYAQRIQQAILPLPQYFTKVFPQSFIYFQPRDIVSGDFYWFYRPLKTGVNWVYMAAADCTGHGVPGAFMSMIGNTLLNEIVNEKQIYETDQILNQLHLEIRSALKQDTAQNATNDGMDIALCRVNLETLELQFSGANRPLYVFKSNNVEQPFVDIKPNKFSIGGYQEENQRIFSKHNLTLQKGDAFYMFSDGYADQFGGDKNKKFMVKRLQNELLKMQQLPMQEQGAMVEKLLMDWKADVEQVDDILMIGIKV